MKVLGEIETGQRSPVYELRERKEWEKHARKALDSWAGGLETSVATAIEEGYRDGIRHAATIAEKSGHSAFGMELRRMADKT